MLCISVTRGLMGTSQSKDSEYVTSHEESRLLRSMGCKGCLGKARGSYGFTSANGRPHI